MQLIIEKMPEKKKGIFHLSEKYEDLRSNPPFIISNRNKMLDKKGIVGKKNIAT